MPRGRPPSKKPVLSDVEQDELAIAEVLFQWCSINGCSVEYHLDEAHEIIVLLANRGFKIIKE